MFHPKLYAVKDRLDSSADLQPCLDFRSALDLGLNLILKLSAALNEPPLMADLIGNRNKQAGR